ncbi:hypothetical protein [Sandarakinorhabdus sp. DWP1-3-1]|uniref:hypothetical protein n=1 Tax=Sandarakinorhabdus sp. DWP1-3-1 TaxID=2804627 RepID=UPI003CF3C724
MQRQVITPGIWWQARRLEASALTPGMRIVRWASLVAVLLSAITVAFDWSAIVAVLAAPGALLDRLLALALQQKLQVVLLMLSAALLVANAKQAAWLEPYGEQQLLNTEWGQAKIAAIVIKPANPDERIVHRLRAGWHNKAWNRRLVELSFLDDASAGPRWSLAAAPWVPADPLDEDLRRYAIRRVLRAGARLTNDPKLRLAGDLDLRCASGDTGSGRNLIQNTDYVASLATDQLAFTRVFRAASAEQVIHDPIAAFLAPVLSGSRYRLRRLSECVNISNQLGASTLAFTVDGHLLLTSQTPRNAQSQGMLAPSGSGSMDKGDLGGAGEGTLITLVQNAAARELLEESGVGHRLPPGMTLAAFAADHVRVFGFGRMIHRAGKPEFYCLAVLPFTSAEVNGMDVLARERPFTDKTEIVGICPVDPAAPIGPQLMSLCRFFTSPQAGGQQGQRASFPLYHALAMLQEIIADGGIHGDSLASFLQARLARR